VGTRAALETIENVARETVGEIDQLVRALRDDDAAASGEVEPPPGLAALDLLVERHRASGHAVAVRIDGSRPPLTPGVDRAAYRILQEALTNAARHGSGNAEVVVTFGADALELLVTNPTAVGGSSLEGHGIVGMRERTAMLGGRLAAEAGDGRFSVRVRLPYRSGERR